ncbi:MAG: GFA family protein [Betaproteobacteria bacterium]|nr:MAG: GFA family protein [Betaproteobacteria bacterium]
MSDRWLRMRFCAVCGTTVSHTSEIRQGFCIVAVPTLDEQDWFDIDRHIWTRSKMPWVVIPEAVEVHTGAPPLPSQLNSNT